MPDISLIVPTLNEAQNLPVLLPRIAAALTGRPYEVLIVDDNSRDDTVNVCAELARSHPLTLLLRTVPKDGLSGAVLHGMAQARGEYLLVMDADLQHPPDRIPAILEPLEKREADFVIGSRYVPGGDMEQKWGAARRILSKVATLLARPIVGHVRDPMSGFFALRRESYAQATRLTPLGYKIGLELLCKCNVARIREVPIFFNARAHGQSKLTFREQFRYVEHLSRLYDFCYPRASPIAKFLIAIACSWIGAAVFFAMLIRGGVGMTAAVIGSYPIAVLITAVFHLRYCRTQREFIIRAHPWRDFWMISGVEFVVCAAAAIWLGNRLHLPGPGELFLISYACATVARYVLRKELLLDIRGLRKELRKEELIV